MNQVTGLIHFNRARQELQKAKTIDVVIAIRNAAAEIRLRAERRAGEMLQKAKESGDRAKPTDMLSRGNINVTTGKNGNIDITVSPATLAEIGVTKMQASRWQSIATIPEVQFEQIIRETIEANRELTQRALLKVAQEIRGEQSGERRARQEALFNLDDYQKTIDYHVATANHHMRLAQHYRKQAFKRYHVQIPLPFEVEEGQ